MSEHTVCFFCVLEEYTCRWSCGWSHNTIKLQWVLSNLPLPLISLTHSGLWQVKRFQVSQLNCIHLFSSKTDRRRRWSIVENWVSASTVNSWVIQHDAMWEKLEGGDSSSLSSPTSLFLQWGLLDGCQVIAFLVFLNSFYFILYHLFVFHFALV